MNYYYVSVVVLPLLLLLLQVRAMCSKSSPLFRAKLALTAHRFYAPEFSLERTPRLFSLIQILVATTQRQHSTSIIDTSYTLPLLRYTPYYYIHSTQTNHTALTTMSAINHADLRITYEEFLRTEVSTVTTLYCPSIRHTNG